MFCEKCGTEIPDEASFCWKCGKPQKPGVQNAQPTEDRYEMCEINVIHYFAKEKKLLGSIDVKRFAFEATAIGTQGMYSAGQSDDISGEWDVNGTLVRRAPRENALTSLINKLAKDGWQPLPRGQHWYSYKFQRRVK